MQYPVVDHLFEGDPAQYESLRPLLANYIWLYIKVLARDTFKIFHSREQPPEGGGEALPCIDL